jgi:preprotein translocase subunit SecE
MAMNRQTKRMMQRQGQIGSDGQPAARKRSAPAAPRPKRERTSPRQFLREVRDELRKVAWPTRSEVINYSVIVLITLVVLTALISGLDYLFGEAILALFER